MREILFRGKSRHSGEWYIGSLLKETHERTDVTTDIYKIKEFNIGFLNDWTFEPTYTSGFDEEVLPETVGQYTGLTDKNGKKIFEGDIVLFEDESPSNYEYHDCTEMRCGVVEYGDNCFYITNRIAVEMEDLIYYGGKLDVEVIGSIHDNPELLKGE